MKGRLERKESKKGSFEPFLDFAAKQSRKGIKEDRKNGRAEERLLRGSGRR